jgi:vitamin B12 transporter
MKKSHSLPISFLTVLLLVVGIVPLSAQSYTDLGTGAALTIIEESFAEAETNTASRVTTITREEIASYQAETTAQLVERVIGTTFSSYGALGAVSQ